jgi:hypothetical protein
MRYVLLLISIASTAHADELEIMRRIAGDSALVPGMLRARDDGGGFAVAATTIDAARDRVELDAHGEVHVYGPVRLIVGVADAFRDTAKPSIGGGVRLLDGPVAMSAYVQYKAEGFTEPEGEIESVVAIGTQLGAVRASVDVAYGQDLDGNERDAELAIAGQTELVRGVFAGATARYRDALGTRKEPIARDALGGGSLCLARGRFAVDVVAGIAMVELHASRPQLGPLGMLAMGAVF